jgi:hypothetical protein
MKDSDMQKLVKIVFTTDPTAAQLGPGDLDLVEALVASQEFDDFGRMVFRALMARSLAALQARRTVAVARLRALIKQGGSLQ